MNEHTKNSLYQIQEHGQSIWLDYIRRDLFDGELQRMIERDGLKGITSNPAIFKKGIGDTELYNESLKEAARQHDSAVDIYWSIAVEDIQQAADMLRPVYDETDGDDGFVSLEVSPHLAHDVEGTVAEAHRLRDMVDRPNVLIKVPATEQGLQAIEQLTADGLSINVTLLFGLPRYRRVADAYLTGLEQRIKSGKPVDSISSVASFFLSRIDVLVDEKLESLMGQGGKQGDLAEKLHGEVAIANAKLAYQIYQEIYGSERWAKISEHGASPQRLLWASTSTKNPDFSDVRYVEALIGPNTVNTMPLETMNAFRDHGQVEARLTDNIEHAESVMGQLTEVGISIDAVADQLEKEGIDKFVRPFDELLDVVEKEVRAKTTA